MLLSLVAVAQTAAPRRAASIAAPRTPAVAVMPADPQIVAALRKISAERVRQTIEKLVSFRTRHSLSVNDPSLAAKGQGVVAAREWIRAEFGRYAQACGGCLEVKTDSFIQPAGGRVVQPTEMMNVYAVQRGTDPEAAKNVYLVTGHYDSVAFPASTASQTETVSAEETQAANRRMADFSVEAPGANDDASGTAVSLECARVLSQHKFPATIIYLTVPGEEQGLDGSAHLAKVAKDEKWQLVGVLNNDIVGGNRTPGDVGQNPRVVRVFSEGVPLSATLQQTTSIRRYGWENDSTSRQLARYIADVGRVYTAPRFGPQIIFRADRFGRGGDHTSFNKEGFAAVRFTEYREDLNHQHQIVRKENGIQYGDLAEFVDFNYVANVARLNAATLAALASAPAPPGNVRIDMRAPGNTTSLLWEASPDGRAAKYEVVWRDTVTPEWQHVQAVGAETKATLPPSKDNVVFAVRAVDTAGHRSLAVIPRPNRERPATYDARPAEGPAPRRPQGETSPPESRPQAAPTPPL
jgi:hypothetical protein